MSDLSVDLKNAGVPLGGVRLYWLGQSGVPGDRRLVLEPSHRHDHEPRGFLPNLPKSDFPSEKCRRKI